ncbi:guanylate kinase [Gammaproteobacteria bacterium]|nr:guanylate kinase [Gammaproteobacteria bacterium]
MSKLFVISAPSGAGKTTLIKSLLEHSSKRNLRLGISCTTRSKRKNETNGESYFFKTKEEFQEMSEKEELLESAEVFGNFYGTPRKWVEEQLKKDIDIILELDWQGEKQIKENYPDAVSIFILPPSLEDLRERLNKRNQDSEDDIKKRLAQAKIEIINGCSFDKIIINDDFEAAVKDLIFIIDLDKEILKERQELVKNSLNQLLDQ